MSGLAETLNPELSHGHKRKQALIMTDYARRWSQGSDLQAKQSWQQVPFLNCPALPCPASTFASLAIFQSRSNPFFALLLPCACPVIALRVPGLALPPPALPPPVLLRTCASHIHPA